MMAWVLFDETGTIPLGAANGTNPPGSGYLPVDIGKLTPIEVMRCHLVEGAWVPRPALPAPAISGATYLFAVPVGASCEVIDAETGASLATATETAGQIELTFAEPGDYALEFVLPPEWIPASRRVRIE
jgi:hypothetical protein